jgi:predicted dehydrogenase
VIVDLDRPLVRRSRRHDDVSIELTPDDVAWSFQRVIDRFVDLAQGLPAENRSPGELGARVVEVLDGMYRSASTGAPVDVARG